MHIYSSLINAKSVVSSLWSPCSLTSSLSRYVFITSHHQQVQCKQRVFTQTIFGPGNESLMAMNVILVVLALGVVVIRFSMF